MTDTRNVSRRGFLGATAAAAASAGLIGAGGETHAQSEVDAQAFRSSFDKMNDRVWVGPECWANPMEDWRIAGGRLECTSRGGDRNVHLLTHQLSKAAEPFEMSVRLGMIEAGREGNAGFRFGVHDELNDYRGNCFFGSGWHTVVTGDRKLFAIGKTAALDDKADLKDLTLKLRVEPAGEKCNVTLTAHAPDGAEVGRVESTINQKPEDIYGNVALVNNFQPKNGGARCWFSGWTASGAKFERHPEQAWGPILWSMHTLSDNRDADGFVLKMMALLAPLGEADDRTVKLEVKRSGKWQTIGEQEMDADARTAIFRIAKWDEKADTPYRLTCGGGEWTGTVRKNPVDKPLAVGNLTCQMYRGFPYAPVAQNLKTVDPDMLFFSGDQLYENTGGYGVIRDDADRAILNYLRKFWLFGWAFGDVMRDRPTVCLPDDHDVFHGNIWGEDGKAMGAGNTSTRGGYIQPVKMVNVVHKTNCGQHPDLFDPTPILQDMSVYYGDMVYGRVSFAILGDRQFKSGPEHVSTGSGRADHVLDRDFDVSKLDKPGLDLLGERQHKFLDHWAGDWRGSDMKVVLSETVFANAATHHGGHDHFLVADLDSGGWPQTQRDRAIRAIRRAFPVHLNGDQHLTTLIQHGADEPRDGFWSFSAPAICSVYQRWWRPDEMGKEHTDRPDHGIPNTGQYRDGFNNMVYVYAVGNPPGGGKGNRYEWAEDRAGGFGILRVDRAKRTYGFESYRFLIDLAAPGDEAGKLQYPGFPHTIAQRANDGRKVTGKLPTIAFDGTDQPVLKVVDQKTGELVYALRLTENSVEPWVYADGVYTVMLGDPDADKWTTRKDQKPA